MKKKKRNRKTKVEKKDVTEVKRKVQDSVFVNMFKDIGNTLKMYRVLHPEDKETEKQDIRIITLENVMLNQGYNDLGFLVGNERMILVEAQTTWSTNIVVRGLMYMAQSLQEYITETKQNPYGARLKIPETELYVIYTGERVNRPPILRLSEEFYDGSTGSAVEMTVNVLYNGRDEADIISQYIAFVKILREHIRQSGLTKAALLETFRICKERNILKEYIESREKEVLDMKSILYDYDWLLDVYVKEQADEAAEKAAEKAEIRGIQKGERRGERRGEKKAAKKFANKLKEDGFNIAEIARYVDADEKVVREWLSK